jgi:hypothetical protein
MSPERNVFVSCAGAASCHANTNLANRTGKSYYRALHDPDSKFSCRGCHTAESAKQPGLVRLDGCQTCHTAMPPQPDDAAINR